MRATHDHRRVWELIPWHVNDTLDPAERDRVEAHLAACPECRAEVELCRQLVAAGGRPEDLAPAPHPAQLDRLVDRIAAEEGEPRRAGSGRSGSRRLLPGIRRLAAVLAILAAGVAGYLVAPGTPTGAGPAPGPGATPPAEYRTLSASEERPAVAPGAPVLRMVFAPATPEEEMRRILLAVRGEIVGGPSPLGVYTVRPATADGDEEPLTVVLQHLRRQPEVLFVEAVGDEGER